MSEALTEATPTGPATDVLQEQTEPTKPQTNAIPQEEPQEGAKTTADAVKDSIDKVLGKEGEPVKPEKDAKAEKAEEKPAKAEKATEPKAKQKAEPAEKVEPNDDAGETDQPAKQEEQPKEDGPDRATPKPSAYRNAPSGFDEAAKAEWELAPESVRGATHRRLQELERGIQQYRADAQEFEPVRKYAEMAKNSGTTLDAALGRYVQMEEMLRKDPMTGLQAVVANLGLNKADGSPVTLRDVAASIMGQKPDQAAAKQEATIMRLMQELQAVRQQIGGFQQHVEAQQQQAKTSAAASEWESFQRDFPRAKELEPQIAGFLEKYPAPAGVPIRERLSDAYDWAVAKSPNGAHTAVEPLVQTQEKPAPNPAGQKSISGAPGGSESRSRSSSRILSTADAVDKAMRAAGV